ncbi:nitrogen assimilation transcriptional regulator NAC [Pantoea phytobeneficialis]|uniref:LysR family transcriptional regulator n=1 Tax=Pantoea phytobeneficialis TaxID=2052056 RepID=A0AAP9KRM4_9GAMM|nr:nitrogen assimilation transcriptional regulator NAC [Pantoea phytobeneficialis]MDO6407221.1 nitrogen assimilation transcriptional regulator NAC [Pantoea phytobeneficialis]QGR09190.1 LysR family transcriptional regulator [Pantoea phytobeneficialis]
MNIRRLKSFITIVDMGSITRAADALHIAQPALSQQLVALEEHFKRQLLIRSQQGVVPTEAGKVLYGHANAMLRQFAQAEVDVLSAGQLLSGRVSVGLAPFSAASTLAMSLLSEMRQRHPGILLHLVESVGQAYSELVANGRLEMALLHGCGGIKGLHYQPLLEESLYFVAHADFDFDDEGGPLQVSQLAAMPMVLPPAYNFVRRAIDEAFSLHQQTINIVAELEAVKSIARAVDAGLGCTIMPKAIAEHIQSESRNVIIRSISGPAIGQTLSLCVSDRTPLSEPAAAVRELLIELTSGLTQVGRILS